MRVNHFLHARVKLGFVVPLAQCTQLQFEFFRDRRPETYTELVDK